MQITRAVTTDHAGETDADARSLAHSGETMEVLPEAHGHSSKQHQPPETCRKKLDRGEAFDSGPTTLRPP